MALIDRDRAILQRVVSDIQEDFPDVEVVRFIMDLGQECEAQRTIEEISTTFDGLDIFVNNAGIRTYDAILDAPWEKWDAVIRVNLPTFVSMCRTALPALTRSGRGSIINVSSIHGVYGHTGSAAYDTMKAGVLAFTRALAFEESDHGMRANSVCARFTRNSYHVNRLGKTKIDKLVDRICCTDARFQKR